MFSRTVPIFLVSGLPLQFMISVSALVVFNSVEKVFFGPFRIQDSHRWLWFFFGWQQICSEFFWPVIVQPQFLTQPIGRFLFTAEGWITSSTWGLQPPKDAAPLDSWFLHRIPPLRGDETELGFGWKRSCSWSAADCQPVDSLAWKTKPVSAETEHESHRRRPTPPARHPNTSYDSRLSWVIILVSVSTGVGATGLFDKRTTRPVRRGWESPADCGPR